MKITFLGTGTSTGVPVVSCKCDVCTSLNPLDRRYRSSIMLSNGNSNIIIDCGPDFRIQMLKNKVEDIDAVLFTHAHRDHIAGLDDIRAFNFILHKSIDIYGSEPTLEAIKVQFPYIFVPGQYKGVPRLILHPITEMPFSIAEFNFLPIEVLHFDLKVYGYRIDDFTYITDASYISPAELDKVRGSKVLVINALRKSKHASHFSLDQALEIIDDLKPEVAYLTHISHFLGKFESIEPELPKGVHLAYDGLQFDV